MNMECGQSANPELQLPLMFIFEGYAATQIILHKKQIKNVV